MKDVMFTTNQDSVIQRRGNRVIDCPDSPCDSPSVESRPREHGAQARSDNHRNGRYTR